MAYKFSVVSSDASVASVSTSNRSAISAIMMVESVSENEFMVVLLI
jgi:hypothetical protein